MKTFEVVISTTVSKKIIVVADDKDKAEEEAHEQFIAQIIGDELFGLDTISIEEIKS